MINVLMMLAMLELILFLAPLSLLSLSLSLSLLACCFLAYLTSSFLLLVLRPFDRCYFFNPKSSSIVVF
jgi:hypothetical protein